MHRIRHLNRTRTLLCMLAFAVWAAGTLGILHRTLHGSGAKHASPGSVLLAGPGPDAEAEAAKAAHGLAALFGDHSDAECRLYDQLSHGPAALCVPPLALPIVLPSATFAWLEGETISRWVALFDARGPPSAR